MISHQEKLRNELAGLKVSIAHYRSLLQEAEEREATIQAALDAYIFPVLTLPPEITTEIFLHYAFAVYEEDEREPLLPCRDILILTMVCRAWRHLALSAHGLWSTIDLGNFPPSHKARREMEDIVDVWFSRAGAIPLSLHGWMGPIKKKTSRGINTILQRHAPRLRDLHISSTSAISLTVARELLPFLPCRYRRSENRHSSDI
ncbi:hypothetical protein B0H16DRAFT_1491296 [Mycena metata]|uniref:F-box domain-containing protein n=1 Tax=Mycena metata TaxID=1033252 RepID=A0AAD7P1N8_9AGAR|nr:hypothetical protein B0H16DRAFT_1491296 [Mycena metata]